MSVSITKYSFVCVPLEKTVWSIITSIQFRSGLVIDLHNQEIDGHTTETVSAMHISEIQIIRILYVDSFGKQFIASISGEQLNESISEVGFSQDIPLAFRIGLCLDGTIAIWYGNRLKFELIRTFRASELKDRILTPDIISYRLSQTAENKNRDLTLSAKRYNYRYFLENVSEKEIFNKSLVFEDYCFDESFNRLNDGYLLKYHEACPPKKLHYKYVIEKIAYELFFIIEKSIIAIFERFYGAHPETKTDFIIRIDAEQKKYELALYRQGLKEPQIMPEDAYQLLVFKNKFEHYRSDNYNQERGAWIW